MKNHLAAAGAFVLFAVLLFSVGLFLVGNSHKAFTRNLDFYTEMANVNGVISGSKVRVSGFDAGQVTTIQIPDRPSGKFRLKMHVDGKLRNLIRQDSVVTIETDGLVGDKFLLIHSGTDNAQQASAGATLPGKEPVEISAVIAKVSGILDQANATMGDVRGRIDGALDAVTATVNNTNGAVTDVRHGKGTVGMLLSDRATADNVRQTLGNVQQASANLNQVSVQAKQVVSDFQSRDLFGKAQSTLDNAKHASQQLDQASQQVNVALTDALGPDRSGENGAQNIRESLSNVNLATSNIADDTEALKHGFLFRGYFKKRGFYSLVDLTPAQYRANQYFQSPANRRSWLNESDTFTVDAAGTPVLSPAGERQIDGVVGGIKDSVVDQPLVIEGYADESTAADQITLSRTHALLVAHYLEKHFHLRPQDVGVMPLNATPPASSGKSAWDGAAIVLLAKPK